MYDDQPARQPGPPLPAEPHEPEPAPKPTRICAYQKVCECRRTPRPFCDLAANTVMRMLESGR